MTVKVLVSCRFSQMLLMCHDVGWVGVLVSSLCLAESSLVFETDMERINKSTTTLLLLFEFPYFSNPKAPTLLESLSPWTDFQIQLPSHRTWPQLALKTITEVTTRTYSKMVGENLNMFSLFKKIFIYLFFINLFILFYLFLAVLGLRCCARAFSSCGEWGLLFIAVRRLLIAVASLAAEHRL